MDQAPAERPLGRLDHAARKMRACSVGHIGREDRPATTLGNGRSKHAPSLSADRCGCGVMATDADAAMDS
jgi:hypothetical protein